MFHMLSCFNLKPEFQLADFRKAFADFAVHLQELDLVESASPVGIRQDDTILDTDSERNHHYFSIMSFRDRAQADAAVDYIALNGMSADATHHIAYAMVDDPVFICWQDS
ncbi:hypothetical protein [Anderseniella sp. Alg231-50]|uniref:hypothetical protein n=1 Tax=Anderseniella sp. Alg231-50 TaxID=1922226 RepID=UPI000D54ECDF